MVRLATQQDIPRLLALLHQVLERHASIRPDVFVSGTTKYTTQELEELLQDRTRPILVATDETGWVRGYAFCQVEEPVASNNLISERVLYLDDLCVEESLRGSGVGHELVEHVFLLAKERHCQRVTLHVWQGNDQAEEFYRHLGFSTRKTLLEKTVEE